MPRWDYDTKAGWDDLYEIGAEPWGHPGSRPQVTLNYQRHAMMPRERTRAENIAPAFGFDATTRLLVIQCGFGWILETFAEQGLAAVKGTQVSTYIHANKALNEDADLSTRIAAATLTHNAGDGLALFTTMRGDGGPRSKRATDILSIDPFARDSRRAMRDAMGGPGYDIITHDGYLNALDDSEAVALSENLNAAFSGHVYHHVYWPIGGIWNGKSPEDWKALLPNDSFIVAGTYQVVL